MAQEDEKRRDRVTSIPAVVERRLGVALALAKGQCGGSYSDACILISSIVSGIAADLWPGPSIDRRRFIEAWAQYADPTLSPLLVSTPLLAESLRQAGRSAEAEVLEALRPLAFGPGHRSRVVIGPDVDMSEQEILTACPGLTLHMVRAQSYPAVFYSHVRSALVHEYHLGDAATTWPMTERESGVSYANVVDSRSPSRQYRQIHYHIPWLADMVQSIARSAESSIASAPLPPPLRWWGDG